jgi:hypothetical protein
LSMCFHYIQSFIKGIDPKKIWLFNYLFPMFCLYVGKFRFNYFHKGHRNMMVGQICIEFLYPHNYGGFQTILKLFSNNYTIVNLALARSQFSTIFCKCRNNLCVIKFRGIKWFCDFFKRWPSSLHLLKLSFTSTKQYQ